MQNQSQRANRRYNANNYSMCNRTKQNINKSLGFDFNSRLFIISNKSSAFLYVMLYNDFG